MDDQISPSGQIGATPLPENKYQIKKERKSQKEKQRDRKKQWETFRRLSLWVFVALLVAGLGYSLIKVIASNQPSIQEDFSKAMAMEGNAHVSEGTNMDYQSNPPTSGNHWPVPLKIGLYETEKPDEAIVHSLEHGRVWVSYKPSLSQKTKEALKKLLERQPGIILTPRSANETDIALAAWTRLDTFNLSNGSFDAERILNFIKRYRGKGPEAIPMNASEGKEY